MIPKKFNKEKQLNPLLAKVRRLRKTNELHVMNFLKQNSWIQDTRTLEQELNNEIKSKGKNTIQEIGQIMFDHSEGGVTLQECIDYVHNLFVNRTFKGTDMETKFKKFMESKGRKCEKSNDELDNKYNVDFVCETPFGTHYIQLKPVSYKSVDQQTKLINEVKEEKLGKKIHYFYYDEDGKFSW